MHFLPVPFVVFALLHATASFAEGESPLLRKILRAPLPPITCGEVTDHSLAQAQASYHRSIEKILGEFDVRGEPLDVVEPLTPEQLLKATNVVRSYVTRVKVAGPARLLYAQLVTRQRIRAFLSSELEKQRHFKSFWTEGQADAEMQKIFILLAQTIARFKTTEIQLDQVSLLEPETRQNLEPIFKDSLIYQTLQDLDDILRTAEHIHHKLKLLAFQKCKPSQELLAKNLSIFQSLPHPDFIAVVGHVGLPRDWRGVYEHLSLVMHDFKSAVALTRTIPTLLSPQAALVETRRYRDELIAHASEIAKAVTPLFDQYYDFVRHLEIPKSLNDADLSQEAVEAVKIVSNSSSDLHDFIPDAAFARHAFYRSPQFKSTHVPGLDLWNRDMIASLEALQKFIQKMVKLDATSQDFAFYFNDLAQKTLSKETLFYWTFEERYPLPEADPTARQ